MDTNGRCDKDALGTRMKEQYENRTRYMLPRRTYTILRLDGKAFHTYTRGLKKPFDGDLSEDMDNAIIAMMPELQGAVFAYTQSDEISVLLTDFAKPGTSAWFDGNLQKMVSVAASIMTAQFNDLRSIRHFNDSIESGEDPSRKPPSLAYFDCRAFTIPDRTEVMNYFRWRQQDCVRNSVSMVAQSKFSHKDLQGKSQEQMHEMLFNRYEINWATDFTNGEKNGRVIVKQTYTEPAVECDVVNFKVVPVNVERTRWVSKGAWVFTSDEGALVATIPKYD